MTLLLNVCQVLGMCTCCPQATFIRGSMIPLGERTPPQLQAEEKGTLESSPGCQVLGGGTAAAATGGHRVPPASPDERQGPFLLLTGHLIRDCKTMPLQGQD